MLVEELIEQLKKHQEDKVIAVDYDGDLHPIFLIDSDRQYVILVTGEIEDLDYKKEGSDDNKGT